MHIEEFLRQFVRYTKLLSFLWSYTVLTATFHASPILAVMLSWIGTQCTTMMKLLIIIKDVGSGRPWRRDRDLSYHGSTLPSI